MDAAGECSLYHDHKPRVRGADAQHAARPAFRILHLHGKMDRKDGNKVKGRSDETLIT
jgi:hypothetical protein